ncbi:MAG: GGDEF domain-containing protein [Deltaproteobacteria bacterium]|nr:GGDEF domain-containing protein [Deltaproteobacteria bacterium]
MNYNDHYGHLAGDECLKKVTDVIKTSLKRASDFVARYGGEEFVCILPDTDVNGGMAVARQIKYRIRELSIPQQFSPVADYVTLSMG